MVGEVRPENNVYTEWKEKGEKEEDTGKEGIRVAEQRTRDGPKSCYLEESRSLATVREEL
jgi:hypothetical protein